MSDPSAGAPAASRPPDIDTVIVGDALEVLPRLAPGSIDCAFVDPPYNLQLDGALRRPNQSRVAGVDDDWDKFTGFADFDAFTRAWLGPVRRALRPNGTLWVMGTYHSIHRVGAALQDTGFWILNDVVWVKTNPMPNFRGRRFTNAHETLIWAVADARRTDYTFNYHSMKAFNDDVQHRSDWTLALCGGPERLRGPDGAKAHPTQKPEALVARALLASTRPGDVVLDPFLGTGTTAAVARRFGRRYVGIERDATYAALAKARIAAVQPHSELAQLGAGERPRRVPFGLLVEAGRVKVGAELVGGREGPRARVRVDGSIRSGDHEGSIHKVGAAVQALPACNGWTYWNVRQGRRLVPLDALREAMRRELA
ncbi:site-specific DNA-methyltransferase [Acuticoccus sp.]|uniref:site-specific DNA-methyltransferase n=1 Tax=Acuticoccus sp. TaxID=1904378 RepID=UPI003B51E74A